MQPRFALILLDKDRQRPYGYRMVGSVVFETEQDARHYYSITSLDCDRVDLIQLGYGLIETLRFNRDFVAGLAVYINELSK